MLYPCKRGIVDTTASRYSNIQKQAGFGLLLLFWAPERILLEGLYEKHWIKIRNVYGWDWVGVRGLMAPGVIGSLFVDWIILGLRSSAIHQLCSLVLFGLIELVILRIAPRLAYEREISQPWSWTPDRSSLLVCWKEYTIPLHLISYLSAVDIGRFKSNHACHNVPE